MTTTQETTMDEAFARAEDDLRESRRDLTAYRSAFYPTQHADRDAATEYRRARLPKATVLPLDAPAGMAILTVEGEIPFCHVRIPGLMVTVCGQVHREPEAKGGYATGMDAIDCLDCLDKMTELLRG